MTSALRAVVAVGVALLLIGCDGVTSSTDDQTTDSTSCEVVEFTWKLAFSGSVDHPQYLAAEQMAADLATKTSCRLTAEVYPDELLGTPDEVLANLSQGVLELAFIDGTALEMLDGDFAVYNLPYVFESAEAQAAVLGDYDLNEQLFTSLEADYGITVLAAFGNGATGIHTTTGPVTRPSDLADLTIGVPPADSQVAAVTAMGAIPAPMTAAEMSAALVAGTLQGVQPGGHFTTQYDDIAPHYSATAHAMVPMYLVVSTRALESMTTHDQEVLYELADLARLQANEDLAGFITAAQTDSTATFTTEIDTATFAELLAPIRDELVSSTYATELLAAIDAANQVDE